MVSDSEFWTILTSFKHIFINQNRNHSINTFLPMRNRFVFSCGVKIHALGFSELLESIFCILLVMEAFSLQTVEILEVVVGDRSDEYGWWGKTSFNLVHSTFEALVMWHAVGHYGRETLGPPVHQCWLQALQFSVQLINLPILLRCNGFPGI